MKGEGSASARVLIADDHALLRAGMRTMIAREPDLEIVGEAENGREAVELCRELRPDLVLMDVGMPEMDGLEATRIVKAESPTTSVLIVSAHPDPGYLIDAVKAGAAGYLLKAAPPEQVVGSIRRVLRGESPLDGELAMKVIRRLASEEKPRKASSPDGNPGTDLLLSLTPRELGVLTLLTRGRTNRQISEELHLSLSTVKRHLERIISKLGVSDHTQAAVRAVELGLIEPERTKSSPSE